MISYPKTYDKLSLGLLKCALCRKDIEDNTYIYQLGLNYSLVCDSCFQRFSKEDIELMTNFFLAFGGYFGSLKDEHFSIQKVLDELIEEIQAKKERLNLNELNIKILHKSLLYGITPQQYVRKLKKYLI